MILIAGSTGSLGMAIATGLADAHMDVTALVRDPGDSRSTELKSAGATLAVGDMKSRATLEAALRGVDTVVCTANAIVARRQGDSIASVDQLGVQNLIDAAEAAKVRRFVFVSISSNIQDDFPLAAAKRAAERRLASSALDYTILLPSFFAETWLSPAVGFDARHGKIRIYGDGKAGVSYVARADVARAAIACVESPRVSRQSIPVGGPRPISQIDAVTLAEKATGLTMELDFMPTCEITALRKRAADPSTLSFLGLFNSLARGDEVSPQWEEILGVKPLPMEKWIALAFGCA